MDNDFNRVRTRKESILRQKASARPAAKSPAPARPAERPVPRPAEKPVSQSVIKPQPVSENHVEKAPEKPVSSQAKDSRTARSKITKKQICIMAVVAPVIIALTVVTILFCTGRLGNNSESKPEPEQEDVPVVAEKTYPKETATAIDIAIAESEIQITERGHYRLSGETTQPIIVNAPGEVVIYLNGISVAPTGTTALANLSEYPLTLILEDDTTTNLQTNSPDANALYSAGDLIIKGGGTLNAAGIDVNEGREYKKEAKVNDLKVH